MKLLFDDDYKLLDESGLKYQEDFDQRFLVINNYPLQKGQYIFGGKPLTEVGVLVIIPENYNMSGGDMFWTDLPIERADGIPIPAISPFGGGDNRFFIEKEYCRWSRHFSAESWKGKVDTVEKILSRIEWALRNPDGKPA
ncbi:MAG: hypothetical protein K0R26_2017 [Bacteroidota bacterium]|jgi:hypothetical protein|nr:hypothetical protein [Bacteroidota bacterium]